MSENKNGENMFILDVPYSEKDRASGLGASWKGDIKKWVVPDGVDLEPFLEWVPLNKLEEAKIIVESQKPEKGLKLSSLIRKVKRAVEDEVSGHYWVNAEIADLQYHKGSMYIQLAEIDERGKEICKNRAIVWSKNVEYINNRFKSETGNDLMKGLKVLVKVKVTYDLRFQLSLTIEDVDPTFTLGGIEAKIKKIRDRVIALGLYDKNKKHTAPYFFRNIAVVSPNEAAGLGDFKADADMLEQHKICKFTYYTAVFQGDSTAKTVSQALKEASFEAEKKRFDAIVLIRGGGAKTDLHFLNEFDIAKQVAEAKVPVFVGVGHERDKILVDEIAFRSFDTPSKVIGYISSNNVAIYKRFEKSIIEINHSSNRIQEHIKKSLKSSEELINANSKNLLLNVKSRLQTNIKEIKESALKTRSNYKIRLEDLDSNIKISANKTKANYKMNLEDKINNIKINANKNTKDLQTKIQMNYNAIFNESKILLSDYKWKLDNVSSEIDKVSPLNALDNGFAIIKSSKGEIIKSLEDLNKEKTFTVWLKDGEKEFKNEE